MTLEEQGKFKEAVKCYSNSLKINPTNSEVWNNKGSVLGELGKLEEAIRCFDEAVKIDPQDISSLYNKGFILKKH